MNASSAEDAEAAVGEIAAFHARHVTHLFDAMAPLDHRAPGLVGAALSDDEVTVEVIYDLHHVHPAIVGIVAAVATRLLA